MTSNQQIDIAKCMPSSLAALIHSVVSLPRHFCMLIMESARQKYVRRRKKYRQLLRDLHGTADNPTCSDQRDITSLSYTVRSESDFDGFEGNYTVDNAVETFDRCKDDDSISNSFEGDDSPTTYPALEALESSPSASTDDSNSFIDFECDDSKKYQFIHVLSSVTVHESAILVLQFIRNYKLSVKVLEGLLSLICTFLPERHNFPGTKYKFNKVIQSEYDSKTAIRHNYCDSCDVIVTNGTCDVCSEISLSYFLEFPIKHQLKDVMQKNFPMKLTLNRISSDLVQGQFYNSCMNGPPSEVSLQLNIDSAPIFTTSGKSITPLFALINELIPTERKRNLLVVGLWFNQKCNVNMFLNSLVPQLKSLEMEGFMWTDIEGNSHQTRVYTILCVADAPMRASVQQMKQYNGYFGCGICEHPASRYDGRTVYPHKDNVNLRSSSETVWISGNLHHLNSAERKGIKGVCALNTLSRFDVIRSVPPDYLHSVLLGVMRFLMNLWFSTTNHGKPWYLGNHITRIDEFLLNVKPTNDIRRCPRSLKELKFWRASEYKYFLLYWGPIILRDVLPNDFYNHFMLLSTSIYTFLFDNPTKEDIDSAAFNLISFSCNMEGLYGQSNATYNNHLLLHIPKAVSDWGPLWSWSSSPFESFNYVLKSSVHGSQEIPIQLDRIFLELSILRQENCEQRLGAATLNRTLHVRGAVCFGVKLLDPDNMVYECKRIIVNGSMFFCQQKSTTHKRISYCAELNSTDGFPLFGIIDQILIKCNSVCCEIQQPCEEHSEILIYVNMFNNVRQLSCLSESSMIVERNKRFPHVFRTDGVCCEPVHLSIERLNRLCVMMTYDNVTYLARQPTIHERNF